jgi:hypothetical protein
MGGRIGSSSRITCCLLAGAALAALVVVIAAAVSTARATVLVQPDLAALARGADAVVHAVVERTGTQMAYNASPAPYSVTQLRVLRWLSRGQGERVWIRDPGAVWRNGGRTVVGAAAYARGEEVIVFLQKDAGKYFRTYDLAAGKLVVRRDGAEPVVEQDLREVSVLVATPRRGAVAESTDSSAIASGERTVLASLSDVLAQLQGLLGAGK